MQCVRLLSLRRGKGEIKVGIKIKAEEQAIFTKKKERRRGGKSMASNEIRSGLAGLLVDLALYLVLVLNKSV